MRMRRFAVTAVLLAASAALAFAGAFADDGDDGLGTSPPDVAKAVHEVLDPYRGRSSLAGGDPGAERLAALGRDAIPEIVRAVTAAEREGGGPRASAFAVVDIGARALQRLVTDADVPRLAPFVAAGSEGAARALRRLHDPAARDALLAAVGAGFVNRDVVESLRPYRDEKVVQDALLAWLARPAGARGVRTDDRTTVFYPEAPVLELLVDAGVQGAVESARRSLATANPRERPDIAAALARAGGKDGVEALVELFGREGRWTYGTDAVGDTLNGVAGRCLWGGLQGDEAGPYLAAAVQDVRAWWEASKDALRFEPVTRTWWTAEPPAPFDVGASPADVAGRVAEILGRDDGRGYVFGSRSARDLAALGRDAIPALAAALRLGAPWQRYARPFSGRTCMAAEALGLLRTDADVPLLAALLREGRLDAAWSLKGSRDPRARAALLDVLSRGFGEFGVIEALTTVEEGPDTIAALRSWLKTGGHARAAFVRGYLRTLRSPESAAFAREMAEASAPGSGERVDAAAMRLGAGDASAIPELVAMVEAVADGDPWGTAAARFAADLLDSVVGERVHVGAFNGSSPCPPDFAESAPRFRAWWTANATKLRFDPVRRVWTTAEAAAGDAAVALRSPPDVEAAVKALLDEADEARWFESGPDDPITKRVVALGRGALPALVSRLRDDPPWIETHERGFAPDVVREAIVELAQDADRDLVVALVAEGRTGLARWFDRHPCDAGRDALVGVVRRGFLDGDVLVGLSRWVGQPEVHEALASWAERFGAADSECFDDLAAALAAGVVRRGSAGKAEEAGGASAGDAARKLLARPIPSRTRWCVAATLATRGVKEGIPPLIETLAHPTGLSQGDVDDLQTAVSCLVHGDPLLVPPGAAAADAQAAEDEATLVARWVGSHSGRLPVAHHERTDMPWRSRPAAPRVDTDLVETARAWWAANADRLRFAGGAWRVER